MSFTRDDDGGCFGLSNVYVIRVRQLFSMFWKHFYIGACVCNMGRPIMSASNALLKPKPNTTQFWIFPVQLDPTQLRAILHLLNGNQGTKKLICLYNVEHALTWFMPKSVQVTLVGCGMPHCCLNYLYKVSDIYQQPYDPVNHR